MAKASRTTEQRMIENEAVFRHHNEDIQRQKDQLQAIAREDGQEHMVPEHDEPLHFYCECADENCRDRVKLKPSRYNTIHQNRRRFVMMPGHEVKQIEQTIDKKAAYYVVEKHRTPPESVGKLQLTPVNNT